MLQLQPNEKIKQLSLPDSKADKQLELSLFAYVPW